MSVFSFCFGLSVGGIISLGVFVLGMRQHIKRLEEAWSVCEVYQRKINTMEKRICDIQTRIGLSAYTGVIL